MRIGLKLTAAFLAIASLVAAAGYLAQSTGRELDQQMERLSHSAIRQMAAATEITMALYADQLAARQQIMTRRRPGTGSQSAGTAQPSGDQPERRPVTAKKDIPRSPDAAESPAAEHSAGELRDLVRSQTWPACERLQEDFDEHQRMMDRFRSLRDENIDAAEQLLEGSISDHFHNRLLPGLAAARQQAERESTGGIRSAQRALVVADQRRGMLLVAAAAVAVSIGFYMSRSIGKPLGVLQRAAQEIGRGCLETRVAIRSRDEIGLLAAAINRMAAELREKTVSQDYVDNIIHSMREMLIVADPELRIRRVNPAACAELGYSAADLSDRPLQDLFCGEALLAGGRLSPAAASGVEGLMRTASGDRIPVHVSAAEMRDETGRLTGIVCAATNVSRQKDTEERLRTSLREQELLLKELHHRVKNNLQIISSLLSLQALESRDPETMRLFQESQTRIRSMALIHEQLHRSSDLAHINFATYVQELVDNLQQGFGSVAARVHFHLDVEPIPLPIDLAIPCGMIVNELVTNALEHAFPGNRSGEIRITFGADGTGYWIAVADSGVGMREVQAAGETAAIGLKVIDALARQIHGRLDVSRRGGTTFTIRFDKPQPQSETPQQP
jgi:PAS domain S-box-containing protein